MKYKAQPGDCENAGHGDNVSIVIAFYQSVKEELTRSQETKNRLSQAWTPERRAAQAARNQTPEGRAKLQQSWTPERRAAQSKIIKQRRAEQLGKNFK